MPKYTYEVDRKTNIMTIWEDGHTLCIISDVTQRRQARILFRTTVFEMRGVFVA